MNTTQKQKMTTTTFTRTKEYFKRKKISYFSLACQTGYTPTYLNHILNGRYTMNKKIARLLVMVAQEIADDEDKEDRKAIRAIKREVGL